MKKESKPCPKCGGAMKQRQSVGDLTFFGCDTWRKCGRHDITGKRWPDEEWSEMVAMAKQQEAEWEDNYYNEVANDEERKRLALMAAALQHGEVKKWDMDADHPHGQEYKVELRLKKADLDKIRKLEEPAVSIREEGDEIVVTLLDTFSVYCSDEAHLYEDHW